jgi:3'-phosphoadenosine 5'-phosphosulfate (PAPS) 3'-phosphatase
MLYTEANTAVKLVPSPKCNWEQVVFCESVESRQLQHEVSACLRNVLGVSVASRRLDSQCKYALVACGVAHIYLRITSLRGYIEKIWVGNER